VVSKSPDPVDKHVGLRVRIRRMLVGMSQEKLGEALGLTFQQVQKYEKGANRIGASRLQQIASILSVPVDFFFEGAPGLAVQAGGMSDGADSQYMAEFLGSAEAIQLNRAFMAISDPAVRRRIVELVVTLAADAGKPPAINADARVR
jgi:transcriptional regulator with XRE-family HTH domain